MSKRFDLAWSPRSRSVELFLNGAYLGVYQLTETVKVAADRVNITKLSPGDITFPEITGGYLLEIDSALDADFWFRTQRDLPVTIKEPEEIVPPQLAYIQGYLQEAEDVLFSDFFADPINGYVKYIDVASFVNWYLVNEITKNNDAVFYSSVYLYKPRSGKLFLGPVWDFDISAGNINYNGNDNPTGWWVRTRPWFSRLFEDPAFAAQVRDRWNQMKIAHIDTLFPFIDTATAFLDLGQRNNFRRWPILDDWVWPNAVVTGSYDAEVAYLKSWLAARVAWMDAQFNP